MREGVSRVSMDPPVLKYSRVQLGKNDLLSQSVSKRLRFESGSIRYQKRKKSQARGLAFLIP